MSDFDYTLRNALLWGNCKHNFEKANDDKNSIVGRIGCGILGVLEGIPVTGQLISLGETGIAKLVDVLNSLREPETIINSSLKEPETTINSFVTNRLKATQRDQPQTHEIKFMHRFLTSKSSDYTISQNVDGSYTVEFPPEKDLQTLFFKQSILGKILKEEEIQYNEQTNTYYLTSDQIFKLLSQEPPQDTRSRTNNARGLEYSETITSKEQLNTILEYLMKHPQPKPQNLLPPNNQVGEDPFKYVLDLNPNNNNNTTNEDPFQHVLKFENRDGIFDGFENVKRRTTTDLEKYEKMIRDHLTTPRELTTLVMQQDRDPADHLTIQEDINVAKKFLKVINSNYEVCLSPDKQNYQVKFKYETEQEKKILQAALKSILGSKFESWQSQDEGKTLNLSSNQTYILLGYPRGGDVYQNRFDALMQALMPKPQKS